MVRKNCKCNLPKDIILTDVQGGHSEKDEYNNYSSVVSSNFKNLIKNFYKLSFHIGLSLIIKASKIVSFVKKYSIKNLKILYYLYIIILDKFINLSNKYFTRTSIKFKKVFFKIKNYYELTKNIINLNKSVNKIVLLKRIFSHIKDELHKHKNSFKNLLNYGYAILGISIFAYTTFTISHFKYALNIEYFDKNIGLVENDYVLYSALNEMNSKVNYSEDQIPIKVSTKRTLVKLPNSSHLCQADEISNKLLTCSQKIICEATGLYINDVLIGATKNQNELKNLLDALLDPYQKRYPASKVSFVDNVSLKEGYYLKESLCKLSQINNKINQTTEEQITYTVQDGDAPLIIAQKNNIPYEQLIRLNPHIESSLLPGEKLNLSEPVPPLPIKVEREIKTSKAIPFTVSTISDPRYNIGYSKILQQGNAGLKEVTTKETIINDTLVSCEIIRENVISPPITHCLLNGITPTKKFKTYNTTVYSCPYSLRYPVLGGKITCPYGGYPGHTGTDFASKKGTPIVAPTDAIVNKVEYSNIGYGNYIVLDIGDDWTILLGHNSENLVNVGQLVKKGEIIGTVGKSGRAFGYHCHAELRKNGVPIDITPYIK